MITEIVLMLGLLGFLCVRNDFIRRVPPFLLAMLFWGAARILMELTFRETMAGTKYDWGSLTGVAAAVSLSLSLFCLFWACYVRRSHLRATAPTPGGAFAPMEPAAPETPSVRLERRFSDNGER